MTIRRMTIGDLARVLDWAAAEGWNPGLEDATAFLAADPDGFFVKEVDGQPVAAISVVNLDDSFAFLGLYLCLPAFRGRGFGLAVWNAALPHAGARCIGLDGVPAQQDNYARSGFRRTGQTVRYRGAALPGTGARLSPAAPGTLIRADAQATGLQRAAFARAWFRDTETRRTLCLPNAEAPAFLTLRTCREGTKIGPLYAPDADTAAVLLGNLPQRFRDGPLFIDVPDTAPALADLLVVQGFVPVFETARMYSGTAPPARPPACHAVATLELG